MCACMYQALAHSVRLKVLGREADGLDNLAHAVRAKVEKHQRVVVCDGPFPRQVRELGHPLKAAMHMRSVPWMMPSVLRMIGSRNSSVCDLA